MSASHKLNDIAMGVLSAALIALGGKTLIDISSREHALEKPGYALPLSKVSQGGATGGGEPKFTPAKVIALLPKASADAGEDAFKKCATCHNDAKGADKKVGPNLWNIVNRPIGKEAGFEYSDAMKGKSGNWSFETLITYLHDPRAAIPGNKMAFVGVGDDGELADLVLYLNKHSDTPAALPVAAQK